jgi:DNA-binding transcriptional regulator YiaG
MRNRWNPERLKALRRLFGHTQGDFAAFLGVSKPTIAVWETGREIPEVIQKLLDRIEQEKEQELERQPA